LKDDVPSKSNKQKFLSKLVFLALKVNDENSRIRIEDPDPDPDPLVRGMDPRTRIRIHTKMSWIRNTVLSMYNNRKKVLGEVGTVEGQRWNAPD
jgi:hypothetical protein